MRKTVLITGGSGFIGSHLVPVLKKRQWRVRLISRSQTKTFHSINAVVKKAKPDVVVHLASLFLSQHSAGQIQPLFESNLVFPTHLLEACAKNGIKHFLNVGTAWQHYEGRPYSPVNLYAATKQAFEDTLRYFVESTPLKATTLKLFDTFGPNDPRKKLIASLRGAVDEKSALDMSPGRQKIDLVHIDDVVRAFVLALERQRKGQSKKWEIFSVNTRKPRSLRDVVATYEKVSGRTAHVRWGKRPYRPREVMRPWRGTAWVPGWKPLVRLEDGLRRLEQR